MTFPVVQAIAPSTDGSVTTHTVTMPSGIQVGDLLIALIGINGTSTVGGNIPTNWTQRSALSYATALARSYWRIADGTEGASQTFTTSSNQISVHLVLRISGHDPATAPEISTFANATSTAPNPGSLSPSWGAADTLWIPWFVCDAANTTTAWPETVNNTQQNQSAGAHVALCTLNLNAASYNAGTFTITSAPWAAYTIAVKPTAATANPYPYIGGGYYPTEG